MAKRTLTITLDFDDASEKACDVNLTGGVSGADLILAVEAVFNVLGCAIAKTADAAGINVTHAIHGYRDMVSDGAKVWDINRAEAGVAQGTEVGG